jgi:glycosyltransferase involved in cell wall biosynthesis
MRAAIFNPYLDTLGGGERYTCAFADVLINNGYTVDVQWKDAAIKGTLESRFGISLGGVNIVKDIKRGDGYDLCFWVSDGSIPLLRARKNILHFQVPFHGVGGRSLLNKMKLFRINTVLCNSFFTKGVIDKEYGVESMVVHPPVDTEGIKPKRKEDLILFVGRFSQILQTKGQDILIKAFKKMCDGGLRDWKLILAGGVEVGAGEYPAKLRQLALGYPVEIIESPDYKTLKDLYGVAKIFWSASGYGENESKNPEKVEHFGITVVEAMAGKAVPLVYRAGGHKEIVSEGENGFLWDTPAGLIKKSLALISDSKLLNRLGLGAKKSAEKYSGMTFENNIISKMLQK